MEVYPLVMTNIAIENGPVEIVEFPSYKMVIFHSYVSLPEGRMGMNMGFCLQGPLYNFFQSFFEAQLESVISVISCDIYWVLGHLQRRQPNIHQSLYSQHCGHQTLCQRGAKAQSWSRWFPTSCDLPRPPVSLAQSYLHRPSFPGNQRANAHWTRILAGLPTKSYGKSPFYSWGNQLFRLGHFQ